MKPLLKLRGGGEVLQVVRVSTRQACQTAFCAWRVVRAEGAGAREAEEAVQWAAAATALSSAEKSRAGLLAQKVRNPLEAPVWCWCWKPPLRDCALWVGTHSTVSPTRPSLRGLPSRALTPQVLPFQLSC